MKVTTYEPGVQVTLYKTVRRSQLSGAGPNASGRFRSMPAAIDLTPFLGDGSSVRTSKSVRDAAGGFSITIGDKPFGSSAALGASTFESVYGLVEPMDLIEIRMRHSPVASGSKPPVVMRGFVSDVSRSEGMSADGRPSRAVSISGQDYGKVWQQMRIRWFNGYVLGQGLLTNYKLYEAFGAGFKTVQSAPDFLRETIYKVLDPYLAALMPADSVNPTFFIPELADVPGTVSLTATQNEEGSIYDLVRKYLDVGVWNELYTEDRDDGVHIVFRPNPFLTASGAKIQDTAPALVPIEVPEADVISLQVARTDAHVANFFWVQSPFANLNTEVYRKLFGLTDTATMDLQKYVNARADLYGIRLMETATQMGGDDVTSLSSGQDKAMQATRDTSMEGWIDQRRAVLAFQNRDNVVFEQGGMRTRGREDIRAGSYVRLVRGGFKADYYVPQVSHEYVPYQGYFSTLSLERGTGFINRAQRDAGSAAPYLSELSGNKG